MGNFHLNLIQINIDSIQFPFNLNAELNSKIYKNNQLFG